MDQFRVNFQFLQCPFEFNVDNTELLQELVNLRNLDGALKLIPFCFKVKSIVLKKESVLLIQM